MEFIDTHTHLYLPEFDSDRDEVVSRAVRDGISKMLLPNIDLQSVERMHSTVERYPGLCYPMIGLHPTSVKEDYLYQLDQLEYLADQYKYIAIGEIGIDLFWDKTFLSEQLIAFRRQIEFALEHQLPVVIHSRDAFPEVFSILNEFKGEPIQGVFHAFTGTIDDAQVALGLGFKLGIGGIVTFKNSGLDKVVKELSPENIILETDSPYLAPVPYRGKRNESSYICLINKRLAEIFEKSEEELSVLTYQNSCRLFNLK
jgi:TatD DNase family protein